MEKKKKYSLLIRGAGGKQYKNAMIKKQYYIEDNIEKASYFHKYLDMFKPNLHVVRVLANIIANEELFSKAIISIVPDDEVANLVIKIGTADVGFDSIISLTPTINEFLEDPVSADNPSLELLNWINDNFDGILIQFYEDFVPTENFLPLFNENDRMNEDELEAEEIRLRKEYEESKKYQESLKVKKTNTIDNLTKFNIPDNAYYDYFLKDNYIEIHKKNTVLFHKRSDIEKELLKFDIKTSTIDPDRRIDDGKIVLLNLFQKEIIDRIRIVNSTEGCKNSIILHNTHGLIQFEFEKKHYNGSMEDLFMYLMYENTTDIIFVKLMRETFNDISEEQGRIVMMSYMPGSFIGNPQDTPMSGHNPVSYKSKVNHTDLQLKRVKRNYITIEEQKVVLLTMIDAAIDAGNKKEFALLSQEYSKIKDK